MCASPKLPDSSDPNNDRRQRSSRRPDDDILSDRLLDAMQTSLMFFDGDGVICRTNTLAREDLRMAADPAGVRLSDLLSVVYHNENILPGLIARLDDEATVRVSLPQDALLRTKDGGAMFFVSGCISRLESGCFLFSFRNVVDELTQEYMIKMALSTTKIFPWFYDFERGVMIIDPRYYDYTGIPTKDYSMSMEEFSDRIHPDDRELMFNAFGQQLNGIHYPDPVPFRLRRGDDRYEWFEGQSTYLGQVEGMPYRIVGICMSTQAHKDIEDALMAAKNRAEQSEKLKSAFLANMSHEIRTPLNAVVGFSNLLAGGDVTIGSDDAREYAALIGKNCDHLLSLVSDILDLSRIETGNMEYSFEEHSLAQLLSDIYEKHRYLLPKGIECNLLLPPDDIRIQTDGLRLRQVVEHLLGNAVKFTDKGHIDLGFTLPSDGKSVRLFVADTGRGIPADLTEKIFERFYKIDSFMQGAGLGLSVCKTIVEGLGGTIGVSSRPKAGSRFTLCLPLRRPEMNLSAKQQSHEQQ